MTEVDDVFSGLQCRTHVWLSQDAIDGIAEYAKKDEFLKKLRYYAEAGFLAMEGSGRPVRHEGSGVYRVGHDLFRLIGFYEDDTKKDFIGIATFDKHGQKLRRNERELIKGIAEIKNGVQWKRKVVPNGQYPRLAQ